MNLVIITETLSTGGAETFVLRLAAALHSRGISVSIIVLRGDLVNQEIINSLAPNIPIASINVPYLRVALKLDGFFYRCLLNISLVRWYQVKRLKSYLLNSKADIAHSNLLSADLVTARACKSLENLPWITTMHGDYLAFETNGKNRAARILNLNCAIKEVEQYASHLISITEQQEIQLNRLMPNAASNGRISKIYNGYAKPNLAFSFTEIPFSLLSIPKDAFVIGMVSRGIREKGWDVIVKAFQGLEFSNAWLVLVGEGDYIQELKAKVTHPRIIFTGNVSEPLRYIERFDIGCLPSLIPTESLPTVLIEYMILGKPVLASDVGEISRMINIDSCEPAGKLIPLGSVESMSICLKSLLEHLYKNSSEKVRLSANALAAAQKFDMHICVEAYLNVYRDAMRA